MKNAQYAMHKGMRCLEVRAWLETATLALCASHAAREQTTEAISPLHPVRCAFSFARAIFITRSSALFSTVGDAQRIACAMAASASGDMIA
jgi:hypothetical protein